MKTKLLLCAVGLASFLVLEKAQSQTLVTTFVEVNPGVPVYGSFDGSYFYDYPTGEMIFNDVSFTSFCVEPTQGINFGGTMIYDIQDSSNLVNFTLVEKLIGGYLASTQTAQEASAFQWAIWEVVAESSGTQNLFDGNLLIDPQDAEDLAIANLANSYLANIDSFTPVEFTYLYSEIHQDLAVIGVIPEPSSAALLGLGAVALLRRRRR